MTDNEIKEKWYRAIMLYNRGNLARRIANIIIDELESAGVTENDIERLFPTSDVIKWIRANFAEPGSA